MARLTSYDLFRKVPREFSQASKTGAIFSLVAISLMTVLLVVETWSFIHGAVKFQVTMDGNSDPDLKISMRVLMYELPCEFSVVDVYDFLGNTRLDIQHDVEKHRMGPGGMLGEYTEVRSVQYGRSLDPNKRASLDLSQANFEGHLESRAGGFSFVNFYAGWCSHCVKFAPVWEAFAEQVQLRKLNVAIYKVDCVHQSGLCSDQRVVGYPTLRMFRGAEVVGDDYLGDRTVEALMAFAERVTGLHPNGTSMVPVRTHRVEGCLITANLNVHRVPGSIRIHAKSGTHDIEPLATNISHRVMKFHFGTGHPAFGPLRDHLPEVLVPYTSSMDDKDFVNPQGFLSWSHYLKVVTTFWSNKRRLRRSGYGYQYNAASHSYEHAGNIPEVKISYDLSPIMINISDDGGRKWWEYMTSVCALIGGIFTALSLMNTAVSEARRRLGKDTEGKLQ
mmetsp:Transcript_2926/g.5493  ORF Transcript_2926/g.5493 Transcript_2926/m.5493 type:complete len:447 (+) Transcript_2926:2521-3861(+)|eukprot:CAMPEP_0184688046 /NCGR_PEP_ID=MMETSP0312-20130426/28391_1 /TAXON_ID=31354 /ORGANISM="Compsopogon coeruleus, Strain SAG 36.94" /LENGTH=446 /DNA_ID=CAMNT_0027144773 /DNA_START=2507 /DNA_END=3847 /DNA_ORIENTATION=+